MKQALTTISKQEVLSLNEVLNAITDIEYAESAELATDEGFPEVFGHNLYNFYEFLNIDYSDGVDDDDYAEFVPSQMESVREAVDYFATSKKNRKLIPSSWLVDDGEDHIYDDDGESFRDLLTSLTV